MPRTCTLLVHGPVDNIPELKIFEFSTFGRTRDWEMFRDPLLLELFKIELQYTSNLTAICPHQYHCGFLASRP